MTNGMYTHENESFEFRQGYREGLEKALELSKELIQDLKDDKKINEACWIEVVRDWIDEEISRYEVGDEG
ncbi:hypothetical protein D3C85_1086170 [compost metagenome]